MTVRFGLQIATASELDVVAAVTRKARLAESVEVIRQLLPILVGATAKADMVGHHG